MVRFYDSHTCPYILSDANTDTQAIGWGMACISCPNVDILCSKRQRHSKSMYGIDVYVTCYASSL